MDNNIDDTKEKTIPIPPLKDIEDNNFFRLGDVNPKFRHIEED